ncbi:hypothetical protein BMJ21_00210, partial [Sinorhizobium medicae]
LSERESLFAGLAKPENTVAELESRAAKIRGDIEALGPVIDLASLRSALEAAESKLPEAGRAVEDARATCDQAKTGHALANQALESALASVPENLRGRELLETAISATEEEIRKRDLAFERAVTAEREASEKQ